MKIKVVHVVNVTTQTHVYTCVDASRQLGAHEGTNIVFRGGPGIDEAGRKVLTAQYRQAETVITYED